MKLKLFIPKAIDKLHRELVLSGYEKLQYEDYCKKYKSYKHLSSKCVKNIPSVKQYLTARPNPNAGIGHQMANVNAGIWFAKLFDLEYAFTHFTSNFIPYSSNKWDQILGYGDTLPKVENLIKNEGYKVILLPKFNELAENEVAVIRKIIASYVGQKVIFRLEQDQYYGEQIGVQEDLKKIFYSASSRSEDRLTYDKDCINIAIHIRRQVKIDSKFIEESEEIRKKRWTGNEYYIEILQAISNALPKDKKINMFIFSTAGEEEFADFRVFGNIKVCDNLDEYESFIHLVNADILLTSKSSFSYKAAMLSKGVIISPEGFWHKYPENDRWFTANANGKILRMEQLNKTLELL